MEEKNMVAEAMEEVNVEKNSTKVKGTRKTVSKEQKSVEKSWKEVFLANYNGESEEAKAIEPFLKHTYKGDVYIPWAVMERLVYMCDENAVFTNILNAKGGLVHSDVVINHQSNTQNGTIVSETEAPMYAHFVKVSLEFMGKIFIEDYPIQEQDYSAARVFNQNLVNKALQRAKAKLGARATGLGLKLYEGFDLQFDNKDEDKKPVLDEPKKEENNKKSVKTEEKVVKTEEKVAKVEEKPVKVELTDEQKAQNIVDGGETEAYLNGERTFVPQEVKVETAPAQVSGQVSGQVSIAPGVSEVVKLIKETDAEKINKVLQIVNVSIMKKYSFALSQDDPVEELSEKLSKFPNIEQFKKTLLNFIG